MKTSPPLAVVSSITRRRPVSAVNTALALCLASAQRGDLWRFLDAQLLDFINTRIKGAPLAHAERIHDGEQGICMPAVTRLVTHATKLESLWSSHTGRTVRSYVSGKAWEAETFGSQIEDQLYQWIGAWLTCVAGPLRQSEGAALRESIAAQLSNRGGCEWSWQESRRSMTYGQLKLESRGTGRH